MYGWTAGFATSVPLTALNTYSPGAPNANTIYVEANAASGLSGVMFMHLVGSGAFLKCNAEL